MNHLTNHYKHKCEQLQEQINNIKRMLNEVNAPDGGLPPMQIPIPTEFDMFGPRNPNYGIPTGQPGNPNQGPPKPDPNAAPQQPLPGASEAEWNQWLDRMWRWYISNYPYTITGNNGDDIQRWWRVWHDIKELHPSQGHGWDWTTQPANPNAPPYNPNNKPVIPTGVPPKPERPERTWPHGIDPTDPNIIPKPSKYPLQQMPPNWLPPNDPLRRNPAHNDTWWETWFGR